MKISWCFGRYLRSGWTGTLLISLPMLLLNACNANPMTLSWQDTSENEDGFRIYRVANNEKQFIAQVGPNVTQYIDKDAPYGACYIVTAFNAAGESAATNSACKGP
jgi:fibronectin type 3 domain-containing protein